MALTFSVDIWDFLGWSDTFAQSAFTERQRSYTRRLKLRELSTPQMVVQGAAHAAGLDRDEVTGLIADTTLPRSPVIRIARDARSVSIGRGAAPGAAEVWLVRYDPKAREVKIKTGESRGKTVTETNVVRELVKLGAWRGGLKSFSLPDYKPPVTPASAAQPAGSATPVPIAPTPPEVLRTAVIVQLAHGGKVLAALHD